MALSIAGMSKYVGNEAEIFDIWAHTNGVRLNKCNNKTVSENPRCFYWIWLIQHHKDGFAKRPI